MSSSFFFKQEQSQENLQYDNTAFLHFSISVCCITALLFICLIYRDYLKRKIPHLKQIRKIKVLNQKLKNAQRIKKNYFTSADFCYKLVIILLAVVFGLFSYSQISQDSKMIGFDPHEILGVPLDADTITIKKSYRKLALLYHPDRNLNNPQNGAKFIQISKAYECLTDQEAKQKCKKYGNPDGTSSFKVGIGLPRFMVQVGNQYFILIPIFIFLLIVVPRAFISWSNRIKPMDANGNLIVNYGNFYALINQNINPVTFSIIFALMKELDSIFVEKKSLDQQTTNDLKQLLVACRAVSEENVDKIQPRILYRMMAVYNYMANRERDIKISEVIPELCHKIMMFTLQYAQKSLHGQPIMGNQNWIRIYLGVYPTKLSVFFTKQMFNPSIRLGDTRSIEFLDLTAQQHLMAQNIMIGNLHQNLLWNEERINSLVLNFAEDRQKYIRQQLECLPALKVQCRVFLGEEEVRQMTIHDFATFEIKVIRKKPTLGYVVAKDFPYLVKQTFNILISINNNLIFFSPVVFKQNENEVVFRFPHRQNFPMAMKFDVTLMSSNYPNMDIQTEFYFQVTPAVQNRKLQIHPDDLNLQKLPKNFFESFASMEAMNEDQRELSEGSDDQGQRKMKQEPLPSQQHKKACCDDHDHRPSFRQQEEDHENCEHDH